MQRIREVSAGNEGGGIKNGSRKALGRKLGGAAEKKRENQPREDGLDNHPQDADGGLLVADFDVAPNEKVEQFAVGPDFAEAKLEKAAGRLDANSRGGGRVRRGRGGAGGDGGHSVLRIRGTRR